MLLKFYKSTFYTSYNSINIKDSLAPFIFLLEIITVKFILINNSTKNLKTYIFFLITP